MVGRRLSPTEYATFAALLGTLLALNGPGTALYGGGAMSAARNGEIPRTPWLRGMIAALVVGASLGLAPVDPTLRAVGWFAAAAAMLMLVSWARGLLIGFGRLAVAGGTMVVEGVARITLALLLVTAGFGLVGASAGLAVGVAIGLGLTRALIPRRGARIASRVAPEVWISIVGLAFVGLAQFVDVVAVRLAGGPRVGAYAAASSLARIAMYAQAPAAAYAVRRTAVAGADQAVRKIALLALVPAGIAVLGLELFPRAILDVTYGGRYLDATGPVRVLTLAMAFAGAVTVLISMMLGAGRTAWVWSASIFSIAGSILVFAAAGTPGNAAVAMLLSQSLVLAVVLEHARRLLAATRGGAGGVLFLSWRDTLHPQGGGSEVFVEEIARRMAGTGRRVTIFCAAHPNAPREETVDGVRFVRRGSWRTVYLWAALYHVTGRFGPHDVVVDVQNAVPFLSPAYCGRRVVVLVHHVHREQWRILFGPRVARLGWWVESRLAPWVYRRASYVTVSEASRADLVALGIDGSRIRVVHNGARTGRADAVDFVLPRTPEPSVIYLGRLVPHKRVDWVLEAAARLRGEFPTLTVRVVGRGTWEPQLRRIANELGIAHAVSFEGFVDEATKHRFLAESWVIALPSVKEGWGLSVAEAALHETPAVATPAGGLSESVVDGSTGLLGDDLEEFTAAMRRLIGSPELRATLGANARARMESFSWEGSATTFAEVLDAIPVRVNDGAGTVIPVAEVERT